LHLLLLFLVNYQAQKEYQQYASQVDSAAADIYKYLNFDKMSEYTKEADQVDTKKIQAAQLT
jgi:aconitate hydratase 2/2-methylisocitrate dehydratase